MNQQKKPHENSTACLEAVYLVPGSMFREGDRQMPHSSPNLTCRERTASGMAVGAGPFSLQKPEHILAMNAPEPADPVQKAHTPA